MKDKKMEYFIIKYKYYQYNSGQGDNGNYIRKLEFSDKNEAFNAYQKFQKYLKNQLTHEDKKDLEVLFSKERLILDEEEINAILEVMAKYKK